MEQKKFNYNRPLGKGSRGPYRKTEPDVHIPEYINLPDGRQIKTSELLKKQTNTKNFNLLHKRVAVKPTKSKPGPERKYDIEERRWQAKSSAQAIAEKYGMTVRVARSVKSYARKILDVMETETGIIIDYTKTVDKQK